MGRPTGHRPASLDRPARIPQRRPAAGWRRAAAARSGLAQTSWTPADTLVVEWRALTIALLDELAPRVCVALGLQADALPLACVLEGGTWAAGRVLAQHLRGGTPPLSIASDGTVF